MFLSAYFNDFKCYKSRALIIIYHHRLCSMYYYYIRFRSTRDDDYNETSSYDREIEIKIYSSQELLKL
jgi:hypothetical protein